MKLGFSSAWIFYLLDNRTRFCVLIRYLAFRFFPLVGQVVIFWFHFWFCQFHFVMGIDNGEHHSYVNESMAGPGTHMSCSLKTGPCKTHYHSMEGCCALPALVKLITTQ